MSFERLMVGLGQTLCGLRLNHRASKLTMVFKSDQICLQCDNCGWETKGWNISLCRYGNPPSNRIQRFKKRLLHRAS